LGATVAAGGAVLVVPAGAFPVGTQVLLTVSSTGSDVLYSADFGGASSFLPSILTINAAGKTKLFGAAAGGWILLQTNLSGVFAQPLTVASSFKTSDDVFE
jgi:hypothetical protein